MADVESKFKISAQATGFQSLTRAAEKLTKAFDALGEAGERMGKRTAAGLGMQQASISAIAQSSGVRIGNAGTINTSGSASARVGQVDNPGGSSGGGGNRGGGAASVGGSSGGGGLPGNGPDSSRGSFTQGFLQGLTPKGFVERGPGAFQQAAGIFAGDATASVARTLLQLPGSIAGGPEGVASAISQLPVIGNLTARSMEVSAQAGRAETATKAAIARLMPGISVGPGGFSERFNSERDRLSDLGLRYGALDSNQTLASLASGGFQSGVVTSNTSTKRLAQAIQAQQGLGVDIGTSMRLMRNEDVGNILPSGAGALASGAANARALGLQGAEVVRYLQQMAANSDEANRNGIKFSAEGQGALERSLSLAMPNAAGSNVAEIARGLKSGIDGITVSGPQNSAQAMMLQAAGYDPENPESSFAAQRTLEDPTKRAAVLQRAFKRLRKNSSGFSLNQQSALLQRFYGGLGARLSGTQAYDMLKSGSFDASLLSPVEGNQPLSGDELAGMASRNTPFSAQQRAALSNQMIGVGARHEDETTHADARAKELVRSVEGLGTFLMKISDGVANLEIMAHKAMPGIFDALLAGMSVEW